MTENTSLFNADELKRTRKVGYVRSKSIDGVLRVRLEPDTSEKVKKYCRAHSINCSTFVNEVVAKHMHEIGDSLDDLTKEELIALVKRLENEHD